MDWFRYEIERLEEFSDVWDGLNAAASNLPILDAAFFRMLLPLYARRKTMCMVCTVDAEAVAAAILIRTAAGVWRTFQPSQAPLGAWVQRPGVDVVALLRTLRRALPGLPLLVSATQLDPDLVPRPPSEGTVAVTDYIETARLDVTGSFEDYWECRSKNLKKNVKRQRNRLDREHVTTNFEICRTSSRIGAAVDDYARLESKGWKGERGTALHPDNAQGRFYRALMERYAGRDEAFVCRYFYNGVLVAADCYLTRGRMRILLKTTYDEEQTTTSPSQLLKADSLRSFFDEGENLRIEFYGRVMDWHKKWTNDFRRLYHINQYRSQLAIQLASAKRRLFER